MFDYSKDSTFGDAEETFETSQIYAECNCCHKKPLDEVDEVHVLRGKARYTFFLCQFCFYETLDLIWRMPELRPHFNPKTQTSAQHQDDSSLEEQTELAFQVINPQL